MSENVVDSKTLALTMANLTRLMRMYYGDKHVTTELNRAYNLIQKLYAAYYHSNGKHTCARKVKPNDTEPVDLSARSRKSSS